jgi:hypothetical protein
MKAKAAMAGLGLLAVLTVLAGCTTGEQARTLEPGMTRAQVVSIMGKPDGFQSNGEVEVLEYTNRIISGWGWDRTDYIVTLRNGVLESLATGEVRSRQPNSHVLTVIPLRSP